MKRWLVAGCAALVILTGLASPARAQDPAAALRAHHGAIEKDLAHNAFGRPVLLDSQEAPDWLAGDVHAVIDHPFARARGALDSAAQWCDVLILHLNVKYCRAIGQAPDNKLVVHLGSKHAQALASAQRVVFDFHVAASRDDYLRVELHAPEGALGTRDYRIKLEVVPLDAGHAFMHLAYTYRYGFAAKMALRSYLATVGSGKVGFTVTGRAANGDPAYVKGVRGVVERNTMRYYLAIDAYVATVDAAPGDVDRRLRRWFSATERYALQLHEIDEGDYVAMKRDEIARQRGG